MGTPSGKRKIKRTNAYRERGERADHQAAAELLKLARHGDDLGQETRVPVPRQVDIKTTKASKLSKFQSCANCKAPCTEKTVPSLSPFTIEINSGGGWSEARALLQF